MPKRIISAAVKERTNERRRKAYAANPEKYRARRHKYEIDNKAEILKRRRADYEVMKNDPSRMEKKRAYSRKWHGFPDPTRPVPKVCEVCGDPPGTKSLHLDHCHETNSFRGWLCVRCNSSIGGLGDSLEDLIKAARYLVQAQIARVKAQMSVAP